MVLFKIQKLVRGGKIKNIKNSNYEKREILKFGKRNIKRL